ncbi:MAG: NAD+ synthase [Gammaproteobacteria bacterium]|nr:NAD+ synthase [Gammaproteobacteria bacterium]
MKIIIAQLNFTVGDINGNLNKILNAYEPVKDQDALLVCTELALTGYYPQDLLLRDDFLNRQQEALTTLVNATRNNACSIVVGYAAKNTSNKGKPLFNALAVLKNGSKIFEYHKQLLPTYNVFDELRHFEPDNNTALFNLDGVKFAFLICEDVWFEDSDYTYENDPLKEVEGKELDCVISINASPSNLGKLEQRRKIGKRVTERTNAAFIYANQIGGNDELVFDGSSFVMNRDGKVIEQAPAFDDSIVEIDFDNIHEAKELVDNKLGAYRKEAFLFNQTVLGIRDYVRKCGFNKVVIGSSGGIDSAVTLAICAEAVGSENVTAITMPSVYSSKGSVDDSVELCENLGIRLLTAPIADEFALAVKQFEQVMGDMPSRLTQENMQARIRGRMLMEFSNQYGALVISTGNKSEMSVGYATLYGDMNGGVNPLGDLYKMEVYAIAKWLNESKGKEIIPLNIIEKEPSAELSEGQQDSDSLPDYPLLDAILKLYIEGDLLTEIEREQSEAVLKKYRATNDLITQIHSMVDRAEFKRRQAPPIIRVQKRSFGMGRWLPVAAKYR